MNRVLPLAGWSVRRHWIGVDRPAGSQFQQRRHSVPWDIQSPPDYKPTVVGLKPSADVMFAGVLIGKVTDTVLQDGGRSVDIKINLLSSYKIRKDAVFSIDSLGFLGDQHIEVSPPSPEVSATNNPGFLQDGDTVKGQTPFNMLAARCNRLRTSWTKREKQ